MRGSFVLSVLNNIPTFAQFYNEEMKIRDNRLVALTYDLFVGETEERELMERATREEPLRFVYGTETMLPAFEKQIKGLQVGDVFQFTLKPEEAYGEYNKENIIELPKSIFEVNGKFDADMVKEGRTLPMMDSEGNRLNGSVLEILGDIVVLDFNHPLAGETLHFNGEVLDVHEPTEEEIAELNADMEDGGCNCGCCGGGSDCGHCG
jgi:FKBP-type peptidyl-prolyl cis-trans isomerase SlyD